MESCNPEYLLHYDFYYEIYAVNQSRIVNKYLW